MESIVLVLLFLAVIGFAVHLITTNVPMHPMFSQTIIVVICILLVFWVLALLFGATPLPTFSNAFGRKP